MERKEIEDKLRDIVVEQLGVNSEQVVGGAKFRDDLCCDSLDCIELVMAVEEEFGVDIPDEAYENLHTFGSAVEWLSVNLEA